MTPLATVEDRRAHRPTASEVRSGARAQQKRRWDNDNRLLCSCGNSMTRRSQACAECRGRAAREREREVLRLRYLGMQNWEIASLVGLSTGQSVAAIVQRLRERGVSVPSARRGKAAHRRRPLPPPSPAPGPPAPLPPPPTLTVRPPRCTCGRDYLTVALGDECGHAETKAA